MNWIQSSQCCKKENTPCPANHLEQPFHVVCVCASFITTERTGICQLLKLVLGRNTHTEVCLKPELPCKEGVWMLQGNNRIHSCKLNQGIQNSYSSQQQLKQIFQLTHYPTAIFKFKFPLKLPSQISFSFFLAFKLYNCCFFPSSLALGPNKHGLI